MENPNQPDNQAGQPLNTVEPSNDLHVGTNGFVMQGMGPSPLGGDIHETFQVDPTGNVANDHLTAQIPGGQKINVFPEPSQP